MLTTKARCPSCRHLVRTHGEEGCTAKYSAGPSGTFDCRCRRKQKSLLRVFRGKR
jgi:hypothetical protein